MGQKTGEILNFRQLTRERQDASYHCFVTPERLSGRCELLICEEGTWQAELFCLYFSPVGLARHTYLHRRQAVGAWLAAHRCEPITYLQALGLLGDAVRQNYKYGTVDAAQEDCASIHLQRVWQEEYYSDCKSQLHWALEGQELTVLLQAYLCALGNRDAALLYDMTALQARDRWGRSLYAFCWGHALEELRIFDFVLDAPALPAEDARHCTLFLTVYGTRDDGRVLSVDICLQFVMENGFFHIGAERILEARVVYPTLLVS